MTIFLKSCGLVMLSGALSFGALTIAQADDMMKKTDTTQTDTMNPSMHSDTMKGDTTTHTDTMKNDKMMHDDKMMKTDK